MSTFLWNFCTGSYLKLNLVINAFFLYCKLFMYLKISDIISFVKLDKSRCISLLLCFWHINCPILMVIYPNNYSNFRTIMEVIKKKSINNQIKFQARSCAVLDKVTAVSSAAFIVTLYLITTFSSSGKNSGDRKSTRLNSSHTALSRMPSSA